MRVKIRSKPNGSWSADVEQASGYTYCCSPVTLQKQIKKQGKKAKLASAISKAVVPMAKPTPKPAPAPKMRGRTEVESFVTALVQPFSPTALGSKVPDIYSFPTSTFHLRTSQLLGTGQSTFGAVYFANPLVSAIDLGTIVNSVNSISSQGGFVRLSSGASAVLGATTETLLSGVCSEFRVVGGGIRLRNLQAALSGVGRIYVACVPVARNGMIDLGTLSTVPPSTGGYGSLFADLGLPSPALCFSPAIEGLPLSSDFVVSSLIAGDEIDINFNVFHPSFYDFQASDVSNVYSATIGVSDSVAYNTATGVLSTTMQSRDNVQCHGSSAIVVYCEGFPAAAGIAMLEVDVIYHLETTPALTTALTTASSAGISPIADNPPKINPGSTMAVETALSLANRPSNIIKEVRSGLQEASKLDDRYLGGSGKAMLNAAVGPIAAGVMKYMI